MALDKVGAGGGSPLGGGSALDRFQQARESARKKLDGADNKTRLVDLLRKKQAELGLGSQPTLGSAGGAGAGVSKSLAGLPAFGAVASNASAQSGGTGGILGMTAYGRAGAAQKADPKPALGRYVDFTA